MATCSLILVDNMLLCSVKLPIEINVRNKIELPIRIKTMINAMIILNGC